MLRSIRWFLVLALWVCSPSAVHNASAAPPLTAEQVCLRLKNPLSVECVLAVSAGYTDTKAVTVCANLVSPTFVFNCLRSIVGKRYLPDTLVDCPSLPSPWETLQCIAANGRPLLGPGGCNAYGCWADGRGGCNAYGCWINDGGCNSYGCWSGAGGSCNTYGCWHMPGGGCNTYGCWQMAGGGCNTYGCYRSNGGCNTYGCWNSAAGKCNSHGCSDFGECNAYGCP